MIARTVAKHRSWTRHERAAYGSQDIELTGERDRKGQREVTFLSGPLLGLRRWMSEGEIVTSEALPSPSPE